MNEVIASDGFPFSLAEYQRRWALLRQAMERRDADAIVVFRGSSVEYLCGYHTVETLPQPLLVLASGERLLSVPDAEVGRALASSCASEILHHHALEDGLSIAAQHLVHRLGRSARVLVELSDGRTPPRFAQLIGADGLEVLDGDYLVERLRLRLSDEELRYLEAAAEITHRGDAAAVAALRSGVRTDSELATAIRTALTEGADSRAPFDVVVATGMWGGIPHSTWANRPIERGTSTFLEYSGASGRYCAPVMRTVTVDEPPSSVTELAELTQTALAAVLQAARPGTPASDVARHAEQALGILPDSVIFHFNFGYPLGIAHPPTWMDGAPFYIVRTNDAPLETGMAFHAPMSFRYFGKAGVGLSQSFVVEDSGARVLTHGPAELTRV